MFVFDTDCQQEYQESMLSKICLTIYVPFLFVSGNENTWRKTIFMHTKHCNSFSVVWMTGF